MLPSRFSLSSRTLRHLSLPLCLAVTCTGSTFGQELPPNNSSPVPPPIATEASPSDLLVPPLPVSIDDYAPGEWKPVEPLAESEPPLITPVEDSDFIPEAPEESPLLPSESLTEDTPAKTEPVEIAPAKTAVVDPLAELEPTSGADQEPARLAAKPEELELPSVLVPSNDSLLPIESEEVDLVDPNSIEVVKQRFPDGSVKLAYEVGRDANDNFVKHGEWKLFNIEGDVIAQGQYRNNERHGRWQRWHNGAEAELFLQEPYTQFAPPFFSEVDFSHDEMHGTWSIRDSQGRNVSELNFRDGLRHGKAIWWHVNGNLMQEIDFANGEIDGQLVVFTAEGKQLADHVYKQGRREETAVTKYPNGQKKSEGVVLHARTLITEPDDWWNAKTAVFTKEGADEKHGLWRQWHPNGTLHVEGTYHHSQQDGDFAWWYTSGQKALAGNYIAGQRNGEWVWWHTNGQKQAEGTFSEGEAIANWIWWNEDGTVARRAVAGDDDPTSRTAEGNGTGVKPSLFQRGLSPTPAMQR